MSGVPVIAPLVGLMLRPEGNALADQVTLSLSASLAIGVIEIAVPIVPVCAPIDDMTGALLALIVQVKLSLSVSVPSDTETVVLKLLATVGVPVIVPVLVLMLKPVGRPEAD